MLIVVRTRMSHAGSLKDPARTPLQVLGAVHVHSLGTQASLAMPWALSMVCVPEVLKVM
jgi:hypothetical protein